MIVAVVVWVFITGTATLITFILPESFKSVARIKVEMDLWFESQNPQSRGLSPVSVYDPYFIQTQFELIQSEIVLGPVIDRLKLDERWGKRYAGGQKLTKAETTTFLKSRLALL